MVIVVIFFKQAHFKGASSCSYCLKQCMDAEIFHSYFLSEVYQFHLPTVLSFHQMYLDSSSVFLKKIPKSALIADFM